MYRGPQVSVPATDQSSSKSPKSKEGADETCKRNSLKKSNSHELSIPPPPQLFLFLYKSHPANPSPSQTSPPTARNHDRESPRVAMASKQSLLVLAAVAACLLLLPAASVATDVDYCSEYPAPGTPRSVWALESRRFSRGCVRSWACDFPCCGAQVGARSTR